MKVTVHSEDFFTLPRYSTSASILTHGEVSIPFYLDDTLLLASLVPVYLGETADCSESSSRMHVAWSGLVQRVVSSEENGQYVLR